MTHATPWMILDLVLAGGGIQIRDRKSDRPLYVVKHESGASCAGSSSTVTFHRAPKDSKGSLPDHFAAWGGNKLEIFKGSGKERTSKTYGKGDYLQKRSDAGYFAKERVFYVDHRSYELRPSVGRSLELFACTDVQTPLALFRHHSHFSNTLASIRIYPAGVWETPNPPDCALIVDESPTKLLERAIIAERMYRATIPWWAKL